MDDELKRMLKYLRLSNLAARWDEYLDLAQKQDYSAVRLLRHVLEEEFRAKLENSRLRRLKRARIPEIFVMQTFPFDRQPKLNKKRLLAIYDAFEYVEKHQNILWIGPTGSGKTGLATSFLVQAIGRGHTGRYVLFPELVAELYASIADHTEEAVLKRYLGYDCLLIDELGHVEVEAVQVGLFFTLLHRRHRRRSTLITSNLGFDDWPSFLKNEHLTEALLDRMTENSHIINMRGCVSLRPKLSQSP